MNDHIFPENFNNFEISMSIYMFFSSVFDPITKANLWPPKAAGNFVVFLAKLLKQMVQNLGI